MEGFIAEIRLFAGSRAPRGWSFCDGQTLNIAENQALYSLIGTAYGGDGRTTFNLPKMAPVDLGNAASVKYIICTTGLYPSSE